MKIRHFKTYQAVEFNKKARTYFMDHVIDSEQEKSRGFANVTIDLVDKLLIVRDHETREIKIVSETNVAYMEPAEWIEHPGLSRAPITKSGVALPEVVEVEDEDEESDFSIK